MQRKMSRVNDEGPSRVEQRSSSQQHDSFDEQVEQPLSHVLKDRLEVIENELKDCIRSDEFDELHNFVADINEVVGEIKGAAVAACGGRTGNFEAGTTAGSPQSGVRRGGGPQGSQGNRRNCSTNLPDAKERICLMRLK